MVTYNNDNSGLAFIDCIYDLTSEQHNTDTIISYPETCVSHHQAPPTLRPTRPCLTLPTEFRAAVSQARQQQYCHCSGYQVDERLRRRNTDTSPVRRASGLEGDTFLGDSPEHFSGPSRYLVVPIVTCWSMLCMFCLRLCCYSAKFGPHGSCHNKNI